jgi:hypothetical protein
MGEPAVARTDPENGTELQEPRSPNLDDIQVIEAFLEGRIRGEGGHRVLTSQPEEVHHRKDTIMTPTTLERVPQDQHVAHLIAHLTNTQVLANLETATTLSNSLEYSSALHSLPHEEKTRQETLRTRARELLRWLEQEKARRVLAGYEQEFHQLVTAITDPPSQWVQPAPSPQSQGHSSRSVRGWLATLFGMHPPVTKNGGVSPS